MEISSKYLKVDLKLKRGTVKIVTARVFVTQVIKTETDFTLREIGVILNKDHSSISHYLKIFDREIFSKTGLNDWEDYLRTIQLEIELPKTLKKWKLNSKK